MSQWIDLRHWAPRWRRRCYRISLQRTRLELDIGFELFEATEGESRDACAAEIATRLKARWPEEIPADAHMVAINFDLSYATYEFFFQHSTFEPTREGEQCHVHALR